MKLFFRPFASRFLLASLALTAAAHADVVANYPNFSTLDGLTLVGSTSATSTSDGMVLRLTPDSVRTSGAAYSTSAVGLGAGDIFSTSFEFRFTNAGGLDPADGITFVLAAAPDHLGSDGSGLGYAGVAHSVAIEFDSFENLGNDVGSNHVAIDTNGTLSDFSLTNVYGIQNCLIGASHLAAGCMSNGDLWSVLIGYDGANLSVSLLDTDRKSDPFVAYTSLPINIAATLGTTSAFVGFTASTGGGFENQDIVNWRFANSTQITTFNTTTPEPNSEILLGGGLAGLAALLRKRARRCSR
jgi:hypothetical protein